VEKQTAPGYKLIALCYSKDQVTHQELLQADGHLILFHFSVNSVFVLRYVTITEHFSEWQQNFLQDPEAYQAAMMNAADELVLEMSEEEAEKHLQTLDSILARGTTVSCSFTPAAFLIEATGECRWALQFSSRIWQD